MAYTEAQKKATLKHKAAAYKRIPLDLKNEEYEELKAFCEKSGESINGFIKRIIKENLSQLLTYTYVYNIIISSDKAIAFIRKEIRWKI